MEMPQVYMSTPAGKEGMPEETTVEKRRRTRERMGDYLLSWFPLVVKRDIKSPWLVIVLSVSIIICYLSFFGYIFWSGYQREITTKFLSIDSSAGDCSSIPILHTESFLVDKDGDWEIAPAFNVEEALFEVKFFNYAGTVEDWREDLANLDAEIQAEMAYLRSISNLPLKVLHLASWRKTIAANNKGTIRVWFNADPAHIFDIHGANMDANMGQDGEDCGENGAWSISDGTLSLDFLGVWDPTNGVTYNSPTCRGFMLSQNGYNTDYATNSFRLDLDLRTAITLASLKAKVITEADLTTASNNFYTLEDQYLGDKAFTYDKEKNKLLFDSKFPDMASIFMYTDEADGSKEFTTVIGKTQYELSFTGWPWSWVGSGGGDDLVDDLVDLWNSVDDDSVATDEVVFTCPSFCDGVATAKSCSQPDFVFDYQSGDCADVISICGNGHTDCSQQYYQRECPLTCNTCIPQRFKVNLYSESMFFLNQGKMDPGAMGCATTAAGSNAVLGHLEPSEGSAGFASKMAGTPPFKLAEDFFTCSTEPLTAFQNQLGIAKGNAGLFMSLLLLVLVHFGGAVVPGLKKDHLALQDEVRVKSKLLAEAVKMAEQQTPHLLRQEHLAVLRDLKKAMDFAAKLDEGTSGESGSSSGSSGAEERSPGGSLSSTCESEAVLTVKATPKRAPAMQAAATSKYYRGTSLDRPANNRRPDPDLTAPKTDVTMEL